MNWKDPRKELPPLDKSYRCLAEIISKTERGTWTGFADVYFCAIEGWKKCETQEPVTVKKWIFIEVLDDSRN